MPPDEIRRLFVYDAWANREALASLARATTPPVKAVRIMAHIIAADTLWHDRVIARPQTMPVWLEFTVGQCAAPLDEIMRLWQERIAKIDVGDLSTLISYKNSKGESFSNKLGDILTHLTHHSAHHRGQIATLLRDSGHEPAYTDFIHWVRSGEVST
jgi:uncharacterized damage-inducible protein DinB